MTDSTPTETELNSNKPGRTGLKRILWAFRYSKAGLTAAWKHEAAFRQEVMIGATFFPLSFIIASSLAELAILIACLFNIVIVELLNSAVEAVVDRIGPEHHELAGRAKDIGSAAVSMTFSGSIIVWCIIASQHFIG